MAEITLKATIRDYRGRSASNQARRAGRVPGVFYYGNAKNIPIEVVALDLRSLVYTAESNIVNLELSDGSKEKCVLREVQFDPITDKIMHIDLVGFAMGEKMTFEVPVIAEGTAQGVRDGGLMQVVLHKIEIECLPADLPEHIVVDVTELRGGESITAGDLPLNKATLVTPADQPLIVISHARGESDADAQEGPSEPEVIARGKAADEKD